MYTNYYEVVAALHTLNETCTHYGKLIIYAIVFFGLLQFARSFCKGGKSL